MTLGASFFALTDSEFAPGPRMVMSLRRSGRTLVREMAPLRFVAKVIVF